MKKIHFENMSNGYWFAVLMVSMMLIIIGTFEYFNFANKDIYQYMRYAGFIIAAIYFSKGFWVKNYVRWNKKSILIRINTWSSTNIKFNQIKSTQLVDKKLSLTKLSGDVLEFDLSTIKDEHIQKLNQIILQHIRKS